MMILCRSETVVLDIDCFSISVLLEVTWLNLTRMSQSDFVVSSDFIATVSFEGRVIASNVAEEEKYRPEIIALLRATISRMFHDAVREEGNLDLEFSRVAELQSTNQKTKEKS